MCIRDRPIFRVASVTMKEGIVVRDTTKPLNTPISVPQPIARGIATIEAMPLLVIKPAHRQADTAITEPTDKSIHPRMMTIVMPHARNTFVDI